MITLPAQDSEPILFRWSPPPGTEAFISVFHFRPGMPLPSTTGSRVSKTLSNA